MSKRLNRRLTTDSDAARAFAADWTRIHSLCIDAVEDGFREYTNYLDEEISNLVSAPAKHDSHRISGR